MAELEGARKEGQFKVICIVPDMCNTPGSKKPVPYQISGDLQAGVRYSPDVNFMTCPAMTLNSRVATVTGNEPGADGGVKSGVNTGHCAPINGSKTVRVNGYEVLFQNATYMWMNTNGPDGQGNTIGKVIYMGQSVQVRTDAAGPPGGGDPPAFVETAAEKSFLDQLNPLNFLKNITSAEGIMSLALMTPSLITADLSNPGAILGAVSGLAGAGGISAVAQGAGLAAQGYSLANVDFSNPGAVLGAAFTAAGMGQLAGSAMGAGNAGPPLPPPGNIGVNGTI